MATGGPNQTATPNPVVSFTPQKDYPSLSSLQASYFNPVTYLGTANTLVNADILGGLIILTNAGAITATLPTAALIVPQIEGGQGALPGIAPPTGTAGTGIEFYVKAGGAGAITVSAGTGGTLVGSGAITAGNVKAFLLIITAVGGLQTLPTYTVYSIGQSAA